MRRTLRLWSALFCALLALSMTLSGTLAWKSLSQTARNDVCLERTKVPVELQKWERDIQGNPTETPIPGAEFFLFTAEDKQLGATYTTDALGKIALTLPPGSYYFQETYPGLGYGFDEKDGRPITQYPFTVKGDEDKVTVTVYDRRLSGALTVTKEVVNADGAELTDEQKDQLFTFTVTFSDGGEYPCRIDGGEEQLVKSGGTIQLKHGQTAQFFQLPLGVQYTVVEDQNRGVETPWKGYGTTVFGSHGHITQEGQTAVFTNTWAPEEPESCVLVVKKELSGDVPEADRERDFHFTLVLHGKETEFTLKPGEIATFDDVKFGDEYSVTETDAFLDGYILHTVNASGTLTLPRAEAIFTNSWAGRPWVEIRGEKTWKTDTNSLIPAFIVVKLYGNGSLVEEKTVTPDAEGRWRYAFSAPKYDKDGKEIVYTVEEGPVDHFAPSYAGYDIVNTYVPPVSIDPPILEKVVEGGGPAKRFEFLLEAKDGAPLPNGGAGRVKRYALNGAGQVELGEFTFTRPGTFVYTVHEITGSGAGWTYDAAQYVLTFTVVEEDGKLVVSRTLTRNGAAADRLLFTNRYEPSGPGDDDDDDEVTISGEKRWDHGDRPQEEWPDSAVVYVYADGKLVHQQLISEETGWKYSVKLPKYDDKTGKKVVYTVGEEPIPGYELTVEGFDLVNTFVGTEATPTPEPSPRENGEPEPTPSAPVPSTPTPEGSQPPAVVVPVPTPGPGVPKTGDTNELGLWLGVTATGALGLLVCLVRLVWRKRRYAGKRLMKK